MNAERLLDKLVECPACLGTKEVERDDDNPGGEEPRFLSDPCHACRRTGTMTADAAAKWTIANTDEKCSAAAQWLRMFLIDNRQDGVVALAAQWHEFGYAETELSGMIAGLESMVRR